MCFFDYHLKKEDAIGEGDPRLFGRGDVDAVGLELLRGSPVHLLGPSRRRMSHKNNP